MAMSELIQEDDENSIQVISTNLSSRPLTMRVTKTNPKHDVSLATHPENFLDGKGIHKHRKMTQVVRENQPINSLCNQIYQRCNYDTNTIESDDPFPKEWWKTGVAFIYAFFTLGFTSVMITIIHERVPDKSVSPPLPDKFFDYIDRVPWAFKATKICGLTLCGFWLIQCLMLKHRAIVARRFFFLFGTLYLYRCITMYITTLPAPGKHILCSPKLYDNTIGKMWRILQMIAGVGLTVTDSHILCGDYLYSGHTIMLTLSYLFIREYSQRRMWLYRGVCFCLRIFGNICILLGHEQYSISVLTGYFITTWIFWWYHSMVLHQVLYQKLHGFDQPCQHLAKVDSDVEMLRHSLVEALHPNYLSRIWWNWIFRFLEGNIKAIVPIKFSWPVPIPSTYSRWNYRKV